jgi:hypothetical protein
MIPQGRWWRWLSRLTPVAICGATLLPVHGFGVSLIRAVNQGLATS